MPVDRSRASASTAKSIRVNDYTDPFDAKAMITFISLVTAACLWFAFAAGMYKLMGGGF